MLDQKHTTDMQLDPSMKADWRDHLTWGHVVLFLFPIKLAGEGEKPKARPCLILDCPEINGRRFAVVAYGTSVNSQANRGYEIVVDGTEALDLGLAKPTRFIGARRILVPLDHKGFLNVVGTPSPVIGRLSGRAFNRMNAVRGRIQAEADIAAERRAERRADRRTTWRKSGGGRVFHLSRRTRQNPAASL